METRIPKKNLEPQVDTSKPLPSLQSTLHMDSSSKVSPFQSLQMKPSNDPDNTPVKKSQQTFEELLESELQKVHDLDHENFLNSHKKSPKFLKRGEGSLCTNSRASTPSTTRYGIPFQQNLMQQGPITPSKSRSRFKKSTSQINVVKVIPNSSENNNKDLEKKEKFVIKPLDLYKIRRERWKIKEDTSSRERIKESVLPKYFEENKKNSENDEINALKMIIKQLTESAKNRESYWKKELENHQGQIDDLKKTNIKIMLENNNLKQKLERISKSNTSGPRTYRSKSPISEPKSPISEPRPLKNSENDKKETFFPNGAKKEIYTSGYSVTHYPNKDTKQEFPDGKQIYFFAEQQTTQITYPNGKKELRFKNGQEEIYFPDGAKEIKYPDGTVKYVYSNGDEHIVFKDGTVQKNLFSGSLN